MTELTGKQISQSYKQLLKVATSANTGVTNDLVQVETGDGTNTAMQISTSIINITGSFGVTENASVSGDLLVGSKVCASAFYGDGSNLTNVPASGDVSVSTLRVTNDATIGGALSVGGAVNLASTLTVSGKAEFDDDVCVSGNTVLVGNLAVGGTATVASNASIGGTLSVGGAVHLGSTLTVAGNTTLTGTLGVGGNATFAEKVCASAFYGDGTNITGIPITGIYQFQMHK